LADTALLNTPSSVCVDGIGNVYIADTYNNCIRKVDTVGKIYTIAGNGTSGFGGDGGPAKMAKLSSPIGVRIDKKGNLYIADEGNDRIRKINTNDTIVTIAGNGKSGYIADGGLADTTALNNPFLALPDNNGNIYIADADNNRIRMINSSGIINTVVGNGVASYSGDGGSPTSASINGPTGISLDSVGNLYIADINNNRVRKVTWVTGIQGVGTENDKVRIYPNPSNGIFQFIINNYQLGIENTVEVYNVLGEKIASSNSSEGGERISLLSRGQGWALDLSGQPAGIYFYRVTNKDGALIGSGKLLKN
jgi:hypothetical protein